MRLDPELAQKLGHSLHLGDPAHGVLRAASDGSIDEALVGVTKRLEDGSSETLHEDGASPKAKG